MKVSVASTLVPNVTIYGDMLDDVKLGVFGARTTPPIGVVVVRAFQFHGKCTHLPNPVWIPVWDAGTPVIEGECGFSIGDVEKWKVDGSETGIALSPISAAMFDLLDEAAARGVSGGVDIENISFDGVQVCADVVVWVEIKIGPRKINFDDRLQICVGIGGGCATKKIKSWGEVKLCYNIPSEICVELSIDKWNCSKSWKKCIGVRVANAVDANPGRPAESTPAKSCICKC
jgi:hypothetical protein